MNTSPISQALDQLRGVVLRDSAEPSDGQLLENFVQSREEAALGALVYSSGHLYAPTWCACARRRRHAMRRSSPANTVSLAASGVNRAATSPQSEV